MLPVSREGINPLSLYRVVPFPKPPLVRPRIKIANYSKTTQQIQQNQKEHRLGTGDKSETDYIFQIESVTFQKC